MDRGGGLRLYGWAEEREAKIESWVDVKNGTQEENCHIKYQMWDDPDCMLDSGGGGFAPEVAFVLPHEDMGLSTRYAES